MMTFDLHSQLNSARLLWRGAPLLIPGLAVSRTSPLASPRQFLDLGTGYADAMHEPPAYICKPWTTRYIEHPTPCRLNTSSYKNCVHLRGIGLLNRQLAIGLPDNL
jgi:hypothetical protein